MNRTSLAWAIVLAAIAPPAFAQDAQTYLYDANGRLIATTTARAGANGNLSSYTLDEADNRVARTGFAVSPTPVADKLANPYIMLPTQQLVSGAWTFTFEPGGNLVVANAGAPIRSSCTGTGRAMYLQMTSGGDLQLMDAAFTRIWHSNTSTPGAELVLSNTGVLTIKSGVTVLWTATGSCF